jgi:acetyl esterase/lipase
LPSPEYQRVLDHVYALYGRAWDTSSLAAIVAQSRALLVEFARIDGREPEPDAATAIRPADADGVPGEWVVARGAETGRRLMWVHGGGWISGSPADYRTITETLSREARASVLALDYRLAPEHPFPAGLNDCARAWEWLCANGPDGAAPARALHLAGDSAGANLALALLLRLKDMGGRLPDAAATIGAATDLTASSPSMQTRASLDPELNEAGVRFLAGVYAGRGTDLAHPHLSPLMGDLSGLPPLLMHVGDREILLDDTLRFAHKARAAGSPVEAAVWPEMIHVFEVFAHVLPEARQSLKAIAAFLLAHEAADRAGTPQRPA